MRELSTPFLRFVAALVMLVVIVVLDRFFASVLFDPYASLMQAVIGIDVTDPEFFPVDGLPEVWFALLALVLGTLLLVVSITSQSIPRLIDIFLRNTFSVIFIWYLIFGASHSLAILLYGSTPASHASKVLNLHLLLPIGLVLAFPYTYYMLRRCKPDQVIDRIQQEIRGVIETLSAPETYESLARREKVAYYQRKLFESLNQLDDILSYITFKGPRAEIIAVLGDSLRQYLRAKPRLNAAFFNVSPAARDDISFLTITNQLSSVEAGGTIFEQKVMRLLRNAYSRMITLGEYDLASLCAKELDDACRTVLELEDDDAGHPGTRPAELLEFFIVWFNTFMRAAIKNAEATNDVRHIFNLLYYYGAFASQLIENDRRDTLKSVFRYLRIYGEELYNKSRRQRPLEFVVDVVAHEMARALQAVQARGWPLEIQHELLGVLMTVDRHPTLPVGPDEPEKAISLGVRLVQVGLALFYLAQGREGSVAIIVEDLKEDHEQLGRDRFLQVLDLILERLRLTEPGFWEDTDRGNRNLYYTPHTDQIDAFRERVLESIAAHQAPKGNQ